MEFTLGFFSIVVLANDNNPTILNPDFLIRNGIVDPQWGWKLSAAPITTPPISTVKYNDEISITVDTNKVDIVDAATRSPDESKIPHIVINYIKTLPHVRYTALGINFHSILKIQNPGNYITKKFIKDCPLIEQGLITNSRVGFAINKDAITKLLISIESGSLKTQNEDEEPILICKGNFHREIPADSVLDFISTQVSNCFEDWKYFMEIQNELFLD
ncbi:MAG: hypothetical protein ABW141_17655 [Candidatus Thiodiazotropha endolucinida]